MMRVLEFLVALLIVAFIGVIAGVASPGSGHVDRTLTVGKDLRQVYDVFDNFRRFPDYGTMRSRDRNVQFKLAGKPFGPGAEISWISAQPKVGNGGLIIKSAIPNFDDIDGTTASAKIVWGVDNAWRGLDKHFTLDLARKGSRGQLTDIKWSYDVTYGWNLINRFANLWIHGEPDSFIQGALGNLQNVLAAIPNVDYGRLNPAIVQTKSQPVLLVSTSIERKQGIEGLEDAIDKAVTDMTAVAKKLGVNVIGPRSVITTNYGDKVYSFDVTLPIDSSTLTIDKQSEELTAAILPSLATAPSDEANDTNPAEAGSAAGAAAAPVAEPGSRDRFGRLVVSGDVRATLAFGGAALKGTWKGTLAGIPQIRDMLKAYSQTHGYRFDEVVHPSYDVMTSPGTRAPNGEFAIYPAFDIYLPLSDAPEQTPEQEAGMQNAAPAPSSSAPPAPAGSAPAPAASAAE